VSPAVPVRTRSATLFADAEHSASSPRCNRGATRCDGSTPSVRMHGDEALVVEHLICTQEERVRLPPSPLCLRSVNGIAHALCTAEVRVRLLPEALTLVAQWTERCSAMAEVAGSTPAGRMCGRSSVGGAPGRHPGEARSNRVVRFGDPWCNGEHSELQPRRSGFNSWRICFMLCRGPERLGYLR
jgi:hypothetical protein